MIVFRSESQTNVGLYCTCIWDTQFSRIKVGCIFRTSHEAKYFIGFHANKIFCGLFDLFSKYHITLQDLIYEFIRVRLSLNVDDVADGDKRVVVRGCSPAKSDKFDMCEQVKATGGIVTFCDMCDTDGCNGASGVLPSALLMLVATVSVLMATLKQ